MSEGQPPEKPTTQLPAVPQWAIELTTSVKTGFAAVNERLDALESNVDLTQSAMQDVTKRTTAQDDRITRIEERLASNSMRAKEMSGVDLKLESVVGQLTTKVETIEKKTDEQTAKLDIQTQMMIEAKEAASKVWKDPKFKLLMGALWTALLIWLGKHGIEIKLP